MGCSPTSINKTPTIQTSNIKNNSNNEEENEEKEENEESENSNETPENHLSQIEEILDENSNTKKDIITIHLNKSSTNLNNTNTQKSLIIEEATLTKENENNSIKENKIKDEYFDNTFISMNTKYNSKSNKIHDLFEVSEELSNNDNVIISVIVKANKYEVMYPIWIENNKTIIFNVSGKWKIDNENECESGGIIKENIHNNKNNNNNNNHNNNNYNNRYFNEGALIGRIFNDEPFVIINNLKIKSKSSGPLFLKTNIYNFLNNDFPKGELNLKITGGILIQSFEEIDQKIGWDKNNNSIEFYNETEINFDIPNYEKDVITNINKIRNNPCLFAIQYLENMKNLTKSTKDLYQFTITQGKNKFDIFKVNIVIFKLLENFYSNYLEKKTKDKKDFLLHSKNELIDFLNNKFENKKNMKIFLKKHYCNNPISLCIKLLFDNEIKNEIFKKENKELEILTLKIKKMNKATYFTILIFSEELGNCNIDFKEYLLEYEKKKEEKKKLEEKKEEKKEEEKKEEEKKEINNLKQINSKKILTEFDIIDKSNLNNDMKRYYTTKERNNNINNSNHSNSMKSFDSEEDNEDFKKKDESDEDESMEHESSSQIGVSVDFKSNGISSL